MFIGIGLPLSRWSRAAVSPLAPYEIDSIVGWWSASGDREAIRRYYPVMPAHVGTWASADTVAVGQLLDQSEWGGGDLADVLGANILENPDFDTDTVWDKGEGWSIADGRASRATASGSSDLSQFSVITAGKNYLIEADIESLTTSDSGKMRIYAGSSAAVQIIPENINSTLTGFSSCVLTGLGNTTFRFQCQTAGTACSINSASVREFSGRLAVSAAAANCPYFYAGGYLVHDETDKLTVAFASDPGTSTLVYSTIDGVTITEGEEPGTSYDLPQATWFDAALFTGTLTAAEKAGLTRFLKQRRDAALRGAIAVWGDSHGAGSGASNAVTWHTLMQGEFDPPRPRYNGSVGGNSMAQTAAIMEADEYYPNSATIIWDKVNTTEAVADWKANLIDALATRTSNRLVILSPCNGTGEGDGEGDTPGAYYAKVIELNEWLAATYPNNYLDLRGYLIADGLTDAGITPTDDDLADIAADTIPRSLLADGVHLNADAQALVAPKVAEFITDKGW